MNQNELKREEPQPSHPWLWKTPNTVPKFRFAELAKAPGAERFEKQERILYSSLTISLQKEKFSIYIHTHKK